MGSENSCLICLPLILTWGAPLPAWPYTSWVHWRMGRTESEVETAAMCSCSLSHSKLYSQLGLGLFRNELTMGITIGLTWLFLANSCNTSNSFMITGRKESADEVVKLKHWWSAVWWHLSWLGALAEGEKLLVKLPLCFPVHLNY